MSDLLAELRADLKTAMRARDRATLSTLRATIAAIENAVAQPAVNPVTMSAAASEWVAGAAVGVGATEVERRQLDDDAVRAIVRAERDARIAAADELTRLGGSDAATDLRASAALLDKYVYVAPGGEGSSGQARPAAP